MTDMQLLKEAEEDAMKQVDAARKARKEHMKRKKAEAEAEVEAIRADAMRKVEELRASHDADDSIKAKLLADKDADIAVLQSDAAKNKDKLVADLISVVSTVSLHVPEARKGIKSK